LEAQRIGVIQERLQAQLHLQILFIEKHKIFKL
jgi:hypothetical protein